MSQHPALPYLRNSEKGKIVTAADAVNLIRDGDTVATGGFVGIGFAEEIAMALEERSILAATAMRRTPGQAAQPDTGLCGGPGRRQGARPQPSRA